MSEDDPLIGTTIDRRFVITRKIGVGGMGHVYEAIQEPLKRRVAVKILTSAGTNARQRFERECKSLSRARCNLIPEIYSWGVTSQGKPYFAMEYLDGVTLGDRLTADGCLDAEFVCRIAIQICAALETIHALGLVHRDIKPSNIMLTGTDDNPQVKLMDFGISHALGSGQELTRTNEIIGSVGYMSPEHVTPRLLDARSDIFSLGCLLYGALTGRSPFASNTALSTLMSMQSGDYVPLPSAVPSFLRSAIHKCIQANPDDRFQSVTALKHVLVNRFDDTTATTARSKLKLKKLLPTLGVAIILSVSGTVFVVQHWAPINKTPAQPLKARTIGIPPALTPSEACALVKQLDHRQAIKVLKDKYEEAQAQGRIKDALVWRYSYASRMADNGSHKEAIAELRSALPIADKIHGPTSTDSISILREICRIQKIQVDYDGAKQTLEYARTRLQCPKAQETNPECEPELGRVSELLGEIYDVSDQSQKARALFLQAATIFEKHKNNVDVAKCLARAEALCSEPGDSMLKQKIAKWRLRIGKDAKLETLLLAAITEERNNSTHISPKLIEMESLLDELIRDGDLSQTAIYVGCHICNAYYLRNNEPASAHWSEKLLKAVESHEDPLDHLNLLSGIAQHLSKSNEQFILQLERQIHREFPAKPAPKYVKTIQALYTNLIGLIFRSLNPAAARLESRKFLQYARNNFSAEDRFRMYLNILSGATLPDIYLDAADEAAALLRENNRKSIVLPPHQVAELSSMIGIAYSRAENRQKSAEYTERAANMASRLACKDQFITYSNCSVARREQGDYKMALEYGLKALNLCKGCTLTNVRERVSEIDMQIADAYVGLGNKRAFEYFAEAEQIGNENHNKALLLTLLQDRARAYEFFQEYENSARDWEQASRLSVDHHELHNQMLLHQALMLCHVKKFSRAGELLKLVEQEPVRVFSSPLEQRNAEILRRQVKGALLGSKSSD